MGIAAAHPELNVQRVSLAAIQEQLERLLSCPSFQNSKRYPKFLKYVVENGVSQSHEELKERVIGVEVFERPPDYEPAADPIVRLVAGETRKRLALYYLQPEHGEELRIEIPPGSYVPVFHWPDRNRLFLHQNAAESSQTQPEEKAAAGLRLVSVPDDLHNPTHSSSKSRVSWSRNVAQSSAPSTSKARYRFCSSQSAATRVVARRAVSSSGSRRTFSS
jgi:hypothetical protein